jgi:hypothetical protein
MQIDNFRVRRVDDCNVVVEEYITGGKTPKGVDAKPRWKTRGYFGKYQKALQYLVDKVSVENAETLADVCASIGKLNNYIMREFKE